VGRAYVLDTSALLAYLFGEQGGGRMMLAAVRACDRGEFGPLHASGEIRVLWVR
jgi:hypothetical protein